MVLIEYALPCKKHPMNIHCVCVVKDDLAYFGSLTIKSPIVVSSCHRKYTNWVDGTLVICKMPELDGGAGGGQR